MAKNIDLISYPFLNEDFGSVDHEVLSDYLSSVIGKILSMNTPLYDDTFWLMEMSLHLNGSVRGKLAVMDEDIEKGLSIMDKYRELTKERVNGFVLPTGCALACEYHIARGEAKKVCRNLYVMKNKGIKFDNILIDFANLMTNVLFVMAVEINRLNDVDEIPFVSKSYGV
ncbi:hypothetical protein [uncultured Clostridium sp.]|jgi:cob(I)alamin adenosyltransferase|uniref:hypothetical protein n=1 Tax=uncultured Clostridium sp. TaxID=59620 RepID=UPI002633F4B1|nr:hypothetical protein [uncultured Clostridium sp.]